MAASGIHPAPHCTSTTDIFFIRKLKLQKAPKLLKIYYCLSSSAYIEDLPVLVSSRELLALHRQIKGPANHDDAQVAICQMIRIRIWHVTRCIRSVMSQQPRKEARKKRIFVHLAIWMKVSFWVVTTQCSQYSNEAAVCLFRSND
jgi:hypothetical protein